jgi:hypothetical protein
MAYGEMLRTSGASRDVDLIAFDADGTPVGRPLPAFVLAPVQHVALARTMLAGRLAGTWSSCTVGSGASAAFRSVSLPERFENVTDERVPVEQ